MFILKTEYFPASALCDLCDVVARSGYGRDTARGVDPPRFRGTLRDRSQTSHGNHEVDEKASLQRRQKKEPHSPPRHRSSVIRSFPQTLQVSIRDDGHGVSPQQDIKVPVRRSLHRKILRSALQLLSGRRFLHDVDDGFG